MINQMLIAYNMMYIVKTTISAGSGLLDIRATIPKIMIKKLRNFPLLSKQEMQGLAAIDSFNIMAELIV
jgi:hypothetical protein